MGEDADTFRIYALASRHLIINRARSEETKPPRIAEDQFESSG